MFTTGVFKAILEKYADPIFEGIIKISKDEWEKFKVDFDIAFIKYLENSYEKYSRVKTILYRTEPKNIYDFFVVPYLKKDRNTIIPAGDINDILDISNFIIIEGIGGVGKSMLMKHFFINEITKKDLIPIFIELKDVNNEDKEVRIEDLIFERLNRLGSTLNKECLNYALKSGCFLFLFDGYDEITSEKKESFFKELDAFCDRYSKNYYIISSRPYSEFVEFQRFTVLSTCPLDKSQAVELIEKIEYDSAIKEGFIVALENELYDKHISFASNPLLLNIMLITFDNYAEIPEKLHLFYENAFETMYSKHDATKAGYRRELKSKLTYDSLKKVFSYFCCTSYVQGKLEFTNNEMKSILGKKEFQKINFDSDDLIFDLTSAVCVLYKEGFTYSFVHRSFQEYFTAVFLRELPDEYLKKIGIDLIKKDIYRASHDSVFKMLYDMSEERFEQNVLLPILEEYEKEKPIVENKYDAYFKDLVHAVRIEKKSDSNDYTLWRSTPADNGMIDFILVFSRYYMDIGPDKTEEEDSVVERLFELGKTDRRGEKFRRIDGNEIVENKELYSMIKQTWIGRQVYVLSRMSEHLMGKKSEMNFDLSNLLL